MRTSRSSRALIALVVTATLLVACGDATADDDMPATPTAGAQATFEQEYGDAWPDTDFSQFSIAPDELLSGGPPKDGIPAIDEPRFVSTSEADFLVDEEPVIVLEVEGVARAYPIQILIWHEIVNDTIGGMPIAVTYCPLCNSAIAFERELDGTVYDFGVSGLLRNSDMVMYDRQTESWWQQLAGEAVVGELTGAELEMMPAAMVSFADFRAAHPDGQVLSRDTGYDRDYGRNPYVRYDTTQGPFLFGGELDDRLPAIERIVAVEVGGEAVAYPYSELEEQIVVTDTVAGDEIVVFFQPGTISALDESTIEISRDVGATGVFLLVADGQALTFRGSGRRIVDNETGSTWNVLGIATGGPLEGARLEPVVHGDHFWFAWAAFQPDTRIWRP